jgi:ankyrin repeat protein
VNKEAKTADGATPLHLAAGYGHAKASQALVQSGVNKEAKTADGATPLHLAAGYGHAKASQALVQSGVIAVVVCQRHAAVLHHPPQHAVSVTRPWPHHVLPEWRVRRRLDGAHPNQSLHHGASLPPPHLLRKT